MEIQDPHSTALPTVAMDERLTYVAAWTTPPLATDLGPQDQPWRNGHPAREAAISTSVELRLPVCGGLRLNLVKSRLFFFDRETIIRTFKLPGNRA
jgi:hypothetical protein